MGYCRRAIHVAVPQNCAKRGQRTKRQLFSPYFCSFHSLCSHDLYWLAPPVRGCFDPRGLPVQTERNAREIVRVDKYFSPTAGFIDNQCHSCSPDFRLVKAPTTPSRFKQLPLNCRRTDLLMPTVGSAGKIDFPPPGIIFQRRNFSPHA